MKKSISNRDLVRIAGNAGLTPEQVRSALAMRNNLDADLASLVNTSARELQYSITMRDRVAMAANTSVATVNRAYRPDARHLVRPEILDVIDREATRLGYKPDMVARSRRTSRSNVVAICPEMHHLANPYYTSLIHVLSEAVSERGLHPVIAPVPTDWLLPDIAQSSITNLVILWESDRIDKQVASLNAAGRRVVVVGHHPQAASVAPDWVDAYEQLTLRALDQSYSAIHLGYFTEGRWIACARLEGVARALARRGEQPNLKLWLAPDFDVHRSAKWLASYGMHNAATLLVNLNSVPGALEHRHSRDLQGIVSDLRVEVCDQPVGQRVALLGYSDVVLRQLMQQLYETGDSLHLQDDLGLAGYDNVELLLN